MKKILTFLLVASIINTQAQQPRHPKNWERHNLPEIKNRVDSSVNGDTLTLRYSVTQRLNYDSLSGRAEIFIYSQWEKYLLKGRRRIFISMGQGRKIQIK